MSVSVLIVGSDDEEFTRYLGTERQFREFRRWASLYGDYPVLNSFPLRYTGSQYRAVFRPDMDNSSPDRNESLFDLLKELVDLAGKTVNKADVPPIYTHILYTMMEMGTEAFRQGLTLAIA